MGLDAYINEITCPHCGKREELLYFRKFHLLESLCADIWSMQGKNRSPGMFNCESLVLTKDILDKMEKLCKSMLRKKSIHDEWELHRAQELLDKMPELRKKLEEGAKLEYTSWW